MITQINIKNLFQRFNYEIILKPEGITIITGPNGYGKSTILKIINAFSTANIHFFYMLDFSSIEIFFDDIDKIIIAKKKEKLYINSFVISPKYLEMSTMQVRRNAPWLTRIEPNKWIDRRSGEILNEAEVFSSMLDSLDSEETLIMESDSKSKNRRDILELISKMKTSCGGVRLISEQRLIKQIIEKPYYRESENRQIETFDVIKELPNRLKKLINNVNTNYSEVANSLDSTYPERLLTTNEGLKNSAEYKKRMKDANEKFEKLQQYNLVDLPIIKPSTYKEEFSKALKIYFEDFTKKYKEFESIIAKLDLFTKIVNSRLTFKKLKISRNNGFIVYDESNLDKELKLNQLSSGEKQEIVLFYELIFGTESELLLIDEPEISLHIIWQKMFMDDLLEVAKLRALKVIVATHSPQIINNHWDIQIDLGELYGNELNKR